MLEYTIKTLLKQASPYYTALTNMLQSPEIYRKILEMVLVVTSITLLVFTLFTISLGLEFTAVQRAIHEAGSYDQEPIALTELNDVEVQEETPAESETTPNATPQETVVPTISIIEPEPPTSIPVSLPVEEPVVVPRRSAATTGALGMSVADTLPDKTPEELARRFDDMASIGITWLRLDFNWRWIQADKDKPIDWSRLDKVVSAARTHDIEVMPILLFTPTWAREAGCVERQQCPPENYEDYANFAEEAVRHFSPMGVRTWEIWNEPNFGSQWIPEANAAEYTEMLRRAYETIKETDPNAKVVMGGLGHTSTRNGNISMLEYLEQLYRAGAKEYFDVVAIHPYSFPVLASYEADWNGWQQLADTNISVRSIMEKYGDSDKEVWITEYGAPTGGPGRAAANNMTYKNYTTTHVTEEFQVLMFKDAMRELSQVTWDGPLFWYTYLDRDTDRSTIENFFGILRADGSKKPVYYAISDWFNE